MTHYALKRGPILTVKCYLPKGFYFSPSFAAASEKDTKSHSRNMCAYKATSTLMLLSFWVVNTWWVCLVLKISATNTTLSETLNIRQRSSPCPLCIQDGYAGVELDGFGEEIQGFLQLAYKEPKTPCENWYGKDVANLFLRRLSTSIVNTKVGSVLHARLSFWKEYQATFSQSVNGLHLLLIGLFHHLLCDLRGKKIYEHKFSQTLLETFLLTRLRSSFSKLIAIWFPHDSRIWIQLKASINNKLD